MTMPPGPTVIAADSVGSTPDVVPSSIISTALGPQRDRNLQGRVQGCVMPESLQTPFEADTVAFGTMYTVQTHADPISVLTMEIAANPIDAEMDVEIYTKLGDYKGNEADPSHWTKIVDTTVTPTDGCRGTIIPTTAFASFTMNPNELRAFFVSLKSADLRYKRAEGIESGQPFVSDGYLSVNVGIGLAGYSFGNQVFPNRMFSGILHYSHATDCNAPSSKTLLTYSFHVRPKVGAASRSDVIEEMDKLAREALEEILNTDMMQLRDEHEIHFEAIDTSTSYLNEEECPVAGWSQCVRIDSKITVSHRNTITGGQLQYTLLNHGADVAKHASAGTIQSTYAGYYTLQTSVTIALRGVPSGVPMSNEQKVFVEQATTEFLEEKTLGMTNAEIIGTKITSQRGPDFAQRQLRSLQASTYNDGWIELTVNVLAMLVPPFVGNNNFIDVVRGAFRSDSDGYIKDLRSARHRPGSPVRGDAGDYFLSIKEVKVSDANDLSPNTKGLMKDMDGPPGNKIFGMSKAVFMSLCVGGIIATLVWIWCSFFRFSSEDSNSSDGNRPEVSDVDSNGQQHRRSYAFFGLGRENCFKAGKSRSTIDQAPSVLDEETISKKATHDRSKRKDRVSITSRSNSEANRTRPTSGHGLEPQNSTRSKNIAQDSSDTEQGLELMYNAHSSGNANTSKSTRGLSTERSSPKMLIGRARSAEWNKTQSKENLRSSSRSIDKSSERRGECVDASSETNAESVSAQISSKRASILAISSTGASSGT